MMILGEQWDEYTGMGDPYDSWDPFEGSEDDLPEAYEVLGADE